MRRWRHPTFRDLWVAAHPATANFVAVVQEPSKLGFLQHSHPLWDITGYHPNYFLLGFRATPSIPTSKRSSSCSFQEKDAPQAFAGASSKLQKPGRHCRPPAPRPRGASRGLRGRGLQGPPGASRGSRSFRPPQTPCQPFPARFWGAPHPGLQGLQRPQGPGPSSGLQKSQGAGASRGLQAFYQAFQARFWVGSQAAPLPQGPLPGGPPGAWDLGFGVFPSRGKSMYIVYIWPTGVTGGRAVPPDVREEPAKALYVHSP